MKHRQRISVLAATLVTAWALAGCGTNTADDPGDDATVNPGDDATVNPGDDAATPTCEDDLPAETVMTPLGNLQRGVIADPHPYSDFDKLCPADREALLAQVNTIPTTSPTFPGGVRAAYLGLHKPYDFPDSVTNLNLPNKSESAEDLWSWFGNANNLGDVTLFSSAYRWSTTSGDFRFNKGAGYVALSQAVISVAHRCEGPCECYNNAEYRQHYTGSWEGMAWRVIVPAGTSRTNMRVNMTAELSSEGVSNLWAILTEEEINAANIVTEQDLVDYVNSHGGPGNLAELSDCVVPGQDGTSDGQVCWMLVTSNYHWEEPVTGGNSFYPSGVSVGWLIENPLKYEAWARKNADVEGGFTSTRTLNQLMETFYRHEWTWSWFSYDPLSFSIAMDSEPIYAAVPPFDETLLPYAEYMSYLIKTINGHPGNIRLGMPLLGSYQLASLLGEGTKSARNASVADQIAFYEGAGIETDVQGRLQDLNDFHTAHSDDLEGWRGMSLSNDDEPRIVDFDIPCYFNTYVTAASITCSVVSEVN